MQWFDDLDDLVAAVGLLSERIRKIFIALFFLAVSLLLPTAGVLLALRHPPLASAAATLMAVALLYRSATAPHAALGQSA